MADDLQYKVYLLEGQENFVTETKEYALKKEYQFPDSLDVYKRQIIFFIKTINSGNAYSNFMNFVFPHC